MMKKTVTRNDVAKLAGVSPAVVSFVLNGTKYVSDERRAAVLSAVEELQYHTNMMARGLKTKRSMLIAFVCDNLRSTWLEEAEDLLFEKGYYVSHCYSKPGDEFLDMLRIRCFDAVFLMTNMFSTQQLNKLVQSGMPILLYKTREYGALDPRITTLVPNYYDAISKEVHYLVMKGHQRIAMIPPIRYKTKGLGGDDFRVRAYEESMRVHGLTTKDYFVCTATETLDSIKNHIFDMMVCRPSEERPTAIIGGDDYLAANIMQYVKQLQFRVPEEVAIVGADDSYLASMVSPMLTTAGFDKQLFSRKLADMIVRLIEGETMSDCYLDMSIIVRESA